MSSFSFAVDSDFQFANRKIRSGKERHIDSIINDPGLDFLVTCGDLTQNSSSQDFDQFLEQIYKPLKRSGILLKACLGNHDVDKYFWPPQFAKKMVRDSAWEILTRWGIPNKNLENWFTKKYGSRYYHFLHKGVRFVCLDLYPTAEIRSWMEKEVPNDLPIVVYWHFNVKGPYSVPEWWSKQDRRETFELLSKYDTLCVLVGHYHSTYRYKYKGIQVIVSGGPEYVKITLSPLTPLNRIQIELVRV